MPGPPTAASAVTGKPKKATSGWNDPLKIGGSSAPGRARALGR